jgi:hypothetical protein
VEDRQQQVDRFEPRDGDRFAAVAGEIVVRFEAGDGADVSGGEEGVDAAIGIGHEEAHRREDADVFDEEGETVETQAIGLAGGQGRCGGGRLESDGEEDDFLGG